MSSTCSLRMICSRLRLFELFWVEFGSFCDKISDLFRLTLNSDLHVTCNYFRSGLEMWKGLSCFVFSFLMAVYCCYIFVIYFLRVKLRLCVARSQIHQWFYLWVWWARVIYICFILHLVIFECRLSWTLYITTIHFLCSINTLPNFSSLSPHSPQKIDFFLTLVFYRSFL